MWRLLLCARITAIHFMKILTLVAALFISSAVFAQTTVVVSTNAGNTHQEFYSLQNGTISNALLAGWDLAFETSGITGSILVNTAKGNQVYKAPYAIAEWTSLDTTGLAATWVPQHNSEIDWSSGALNQGLTSNPFDLGWGIYNMVSHNIAGDSLFVLKMADGTWKKLRMDGYAAATNAFTFTWADLDGGSEQVGSIVRGDYSSMNFGYYSLETNSPLAQEPDAATWDLVFTKYVGFVSQPQPSFYPVVGCLQNREVLALQVDGVPSATATWSDGTFSEDINVIGFDWKNFNMSTFMWEYAPDRTYFVQDRNGNIWKLVFTEYGGGATGEITFTQELVSATGVDELASNGTVLVYPNPSSAENVNVLLDIPSNEAVLSITDLNGKLVHSQKLFGIRPLTVQPLGVSELSAGVYTIHIVHTNGVTNSKLVIE